MKSFLLFEAVNGQRLCFKYKRCVKASYFSQLNRKWDKFSSFDILVLFLFNLTAKLLKTRLFAETKPWITNTISNKFIGIMIHCNVYHIQWLREFNEVTIRVAKDRLKYVVQTNMLVHELGFMGMCVVDASADVSTSYFQCNVSYAVDFQFYGFEWKKVMNFLGSFGLLFHSLIDSQLICLKQT